MMRPRLNSGLRGKHADSVPESLMTDNPYKPPEVPTGETSAGSGMTVTAWGYGLRNMLLLTIPGLLLYGVIFLAITVAFELTPAVAFGAATSVVMLGAMLAMLIGYLRGRRRRGACLLDCGRHPTRWLFALNAALFTVMGVIQLWTGNPAGWFGALFPLTFALYWVVMCTGRLCIYENGIWTYWGLLRWEKIAQYAWKKHRTLVIRTTGFWSFLSRGAIPVPEAFVRDFSLILSEHIPEAATATDT
jgi:hypothetical protein